MTEVGKDFLLERSSGPSSLLKEVYLELVARGMSRWLSNISEDRDATTSLGNFYQCSVILIVKMFFLVFGQSLQFQYVPITSGPVTGHHWKEPGSLLIVPSFQLFIHIDKVLLEPPLLQAELFQLAQPFFVGEMLQSLHDPCGPSLHSLQCVHVSFQLESP